MNELDPYFALKNISQIQQANITAGSMLSEAREATGLTTNSLASLMKVSLKKIEAIEADRFDLLPDMVFARALALSICRHLKTDPDPILKQFPPTTVHNLKSDESGINAPFRTPQNVSRIRFVNLLTRPIALFFIVALLAALSLYFFSTSYTVKTEGVFPEPVSQMNLAPPEEEKNTTVNLVSLKTVFDTPSIQLPVPAANEKGKAVSPGGQVVFKSRGTSWVEVVDANGSVQLRKVLVAGDVIGASGALPLAVVVGKADAIDVFIAGKPFNVVGVAKENIARFEVK